MDNKLFRKKSVDKVSSPDRLNDYIKVARPGLWLLLVGVIALLAGAIVWACACKIPSRVSATFAVNNKVATATLSQTDFAKVQIQDKVTFIQTNSETQEKTYTEATVSSKEKESWKVTVNIDFADGNYDGEIAVNFTPITFLIN